MVDNTTLNSGTGGDTIASDDIGGIKYQRVKINYGIDGAATDVSDTNPLPVDDAGGSLTVDNGGTFAVQVDAALPAGTNAIGKLAANSGVDIGDVDVLSVIPGTGATNLGKAEDAAHSDGDTGVFVLGVRQDTDVSMVDATGDYAPVQISDTGAVKVEIFDGGDSHTVDGTVTANAGSGTFTVDNAGVFAVQVDAALPAGTNAIGKLAANSGVDIGDVDVTSVVPGTGATNLGKAEDAVHADGDTGVMSLAVRRDADTTLAGTDGDYAPLQVDAAGKLKVEIFAGGDTHPVSGTVDIADITTSITPGTAAGNLGKAEDSAHTDASTGVMVLAVQQAADSSMVSTDGDYAPLQVDANGKLKVEVFDGGDSHTIDNSTLAVVGGGTEATALRVTVANDSTGVLSVDDNAGSLTVDNAALSVTGGGAEATALRVTIANDSTGVVSVDDGGGALTVDGTVTADAGTGTFTVGGVAAHDAAVSGNPVLGAGEARTTNPTAVADGDVVRSMHDDVGRQVVTLGHVRDLTTHNRIVLTDTTETTLIADPGAGVFADMSHIVMSNESGSELRVDIRDSTAGTVRLSVDLAADGGGAVIPYNIPLKQATAANNWTAQLSGTASSVYITAQAVLNV